MTLFLLRFAAVVAACMLALPAGAAKALVEFLASPETAALLKAKGFELAR